MSHFHKVKIKDIRRETNDCVSIALDIPAELKDNFVYKQGQYITLKLTIRGEELRRSYSACSSPVADSDLRIAVKAVENGKVSTFLNNGISVGQELEVMNPMGNFFVEMPSDKEQHFVAFAAGSGITPILSLLKTALAVNETNKFSLFYGNKSTDDIIFKQELNELVVKYENRLQVHHILSREKTADKLFEGRISPEKCLDLLMNFEEIQNADAYFLCGPYDMTMGLKDKLIEFGIPKEKVHFELFTTVEKETGPEIGESPSTSTDTKVTIVLDGEETELTISGNESVLDAALDAGLDAPYACTGGSCCTCRAKLMEGSVKMDVNYALTDQEVENGYILTCQSHPTSPKIVVDYDEP
ncbi:2Fe-2S iron-sulfur cluster binding domain-containing protein [Cryomorpha ignava]|uniref:2Fe-2S iron-sulfur cluster binding domain-containing protein n=1 Tax=Cryomorpha ignava TaxID=101383 RepID=A0A7K3WTR3_9FLAO|nr:2Fe-2S iron-sulfur cluster-binding protein [Cryomorpha ignava]NEN24411.1 2Fe-2S iron-sulfur cluster binding domain-containing protein [Cryomorpha ignava]